MPVIEAFGTSVERISGESVKNSSAPERSWLSMSVSPPSWLFGNTWMSTLPPVSLRIASIASIVRIFSGCVIGELLAYLSEKSAALTRVTLSSAGAATPAPSDSFNAVRREIGFIDGPPERRVSGARLWIGMEQPPDGGPFRGGHFHSLPPLSRRKRRLRR